MDKIFLWVLVGLVLVYAFQPVPACVPIPEDELSTTPPETIYSGERIDRLNAELDSKGFITIQTIGDSMLPTIKTNSACLCERKKYYQGDIVLFFTDNNQGIAHRFFSEIDGMIFTKGDNNNFTESTTKEKILCSIPEVRRYELWKW